MALKPQDVVLVTSVLVRGWPRTYADLAKSLKVSVSEAHGSVRRAIEAGLLHTVPIIAANRTALEEFVVHGLKYVFPAGRGPLTRGMPTSYATSPLNGEIVYRGDDIPVWPDSEGEVRGYELPPLCPSVPAIAKEDAELYEWFALFDALRSGRVRERKLAEDELRKRIHAKPPDQP